MNKLFSCRALMAAIALLVMSSLTPASAEQKVADGDYEIHYNAFNSTFVLPKVAQQYQLLRSKNSALVNISILKKQADGTTKPVTGIVKGTATNLIQQQQTLEFRKVDEGNAIYYLGQFGFSDEMVMRLSVTVQPNPNKPPYEISWEQQFYKD